MFSVVNAFIFGKILLLFIKFVRTIFVRCSPCMKYAIGIRHDFKLKTFDEERRTKIVGKN
jgi:hypothetical protein